MKKEFQTSYRLLNADVFRSVAARDLARSRRVDKKHLLLAGDDTDAREALRLGLADTYEVTAVADGAAALAMLDTRQFDVMLVDLNAPGSLLDEINAGRLSIPSVFACDTFASARIVKASGAAHVMKPMGLAAIEEGLSFVMTEAFDRECPTQPSIER